MTEETGEKSSCEKGLKRFDDKNAQQKGESKNLRAFNENQYSKLLFKIRKQRIEEHDSETDLKPCQSDSTSAAKWEAKKPHLDPRRGFKDLVWRDLLTHQWLPSPIIWDRIAVGKLTCEMGLEMERRRYAVLLGDVFADANDTSPVEADRIRLRQLYCRVVRLGISQGAHIFVHLGPESFLVKDTLRDVHSVRYEAGGSVLYKEAQAIVRDVVWHFKDDQPFYLISIAGKRLPKRLYNSDLVATDPLS